MHLIFATCALTSGCANLTTYNRLRYDVARIGETTFIDAKQRAVFAIPHDNGNGAWETRICAEPSPDALSALAASGSGGLSFAQKASIQAAYVVSETASSIGLRTQSIQLMRDAMFRMCEGVASGTLTSFQFETLYRRFQNSMVTILAIEQLTGVVKAGGAQLSSNAGTGASKDIATLSEDAAKARDASATADKDTDKAAEALAAAKVKQDTYLKEKGGDADKLTDAQKAEFSPIQKAYADAAAANTAAITAATAAKEKLAIYQAGMQAVHGGDLATSGTAAVYGGTGGPLDPTSASAIAAAVQAIVTEQLNSGFFRDACATLFDAELNARQIGAQADSLKSDCHLYALTSIENSRRQMDAYVQSASAQSAAYVRYMAD